MKYLLIILVVLAGIWIWRSARQADLKRNRPSSNAPPQPLDMVRCTLCSVHVPSVDAIQGKNGLYCSADHLRIAEH